MALRDVGTWLPGAVVSSIPLDELRVIRDRVLANRCNNCDGLLPSLTRKVCPSCLFTADPTASPWSGQHDRGVCPTCSLRIQLRANGTMGAHQLAAGVYCDGEGKDPVET